MKALPGRTVDLLHDGVPAWKMTGPNGGDKAVYRTLVATAASAIEAGWDVIAWSYEVDRAGQRLGQQARMRGGRRERKRLDVEKMYRSAWNDAHVWLSTRPPAWSSADARAEAERIAAQATAIIENPDNDLDDAQRRVLEHAAAEMRRRGITRIALPRDAMLQATGLGLTALRTALARLEAAGLLVLVDRGRRYGPRSTTEPTRRKANLYRLAGAGAGEVALYLYRGTRSVVPPAQICSAPADESTGAPGKVCSAPLETTPTPVGFGVAAPVTSAQEAFLATLDPTARARVLAALADAAPDG